MAAEAPRVSWSSFGALLLVLFGGAVLLFFAATFLFRGFQIGGHPDPALERIFALEVLAAEAADRGDLKEAIELYLEAVGACAEGERAPYRGERAHCHFELARLQEARGNPALALAHYEAFAEDWSQDEVLDDMLRVRLDLYGRDAAITWLTGPDVPSTRVDLAMLAAEWTEADGDLEDAEALALSYLRRARLVQDVRELLGPDLEGYPRGEFMGASRSERVRAFDVLARSRLARGDAEGAERAARAAVHQAQAPRPEADERPPHERGAWGHAVLARLAFDRGDEAAANEHLDLARRALPAASGWPLLEPLLDAATAPE